MHNYSVCIQKCFLRCFDSNKSDDECFDSFCKSCHMYTNKTIQGEQLMLTVKKCIISNEWTLQVL